MGGIILFHKLNDEGSDGAVPFERLFGFETYQKFLGGVKTDAVVMIIIWFLPCFTSYPFLRSGTLSSFKI